MEAKSVFSADDAANATIFLAYSRAALSWVERVPIAAGWDPLDSRSAFFVCSLDWDRQFLRKFHQEQPPKSKSISSLKPNVGSSEVLQDGRIDTPRPKFCQEILVTTTKDSAI